MRRAALALRIAWIAHGSPSSSHGLFRPSAAAARTGSSDSGTSADGAPSFSCASVARTTPSRGTSSSHELLRKGRAWSVTWRTTLHSALVRKTSEGPHAPLTRRDALVVHPGARDARGADAEHAHARVLRKQPHAAQQQEQWQHVAVPGAALQGTLSSARSAMVKLFSAALVAQYTAMPGMATMPALEASRANNQTLDAQQ